MAINPLMYNTWLYNGGDTTLSEINDSWELEAFVRTIKNNFPVFLTINHRGKRYGVTHAEFPPEWDTELGFVSSDWDSVISETEARVYDLNIEDSLYGDRYINHVVWSREIVSTARKHSEFTLPKITGVDLVFHGHSFVTNPIQVSNRVYIDTGGVFNGVLTGAIPMPDGNILFMCTKPNVGELV